MDEGLAIKVESVGKIFRLPHEKQKSLKGTLINFRKRGYEKQVALHNISFEVKKGEFFGIVGRNGSGKSTLLKILAGIYSPSSGSVQINGKLTPFIELGVGFNEELTGRENVYLNGALFGFSRKEMDAMYGDIVEFAELEKFMDQRLKNYSSGMQVRLAFSIAIRAKSDILLLDEVLAVGDTLFQQKCFSYFSQLKHEKRTVLLVSHDINVIRQYCTRGVLIERGEMVVNDDINTVVNRYIDIVSELESVQQTKEKQTHEEQRRGTGKITVENLRIKTGNQVLTSKDDSFVVDADFMAHESCASPVFGIVIRDSFGNQIMGSNNMWHNMKAKDLEAGKTQKVRWEIPNIFNTGEYTISPAAADSWGKEIYDWVDDMKSFRVRKSTASSSLTDPQHKMELL